MNNNDSENCSTLNFFRHWPTVCASGLRVWLELQSLKRVVNRRSSNYVFLQVGLMNVVVLSLQQT